MFRVSFPGLAILILLFVVRSSEAQNTFEQLAKRMPPDANVVMVLDVGKIKNSDVAQREGWVTTRAGRIDSGMIFVPEGSMLMLASQMDLDLLKPKWTAAILETDATTSLQGLGGSPDQINDQPVMASAHDMFFSSLMTGPSVRSFPPTARPPRHGWAN